MTGVLYRWGWNGKPDRLLYRRASRPAAPLRPPGAALPADAGTSWAHP